MTINELIAHLEVLRDNFGGDTEANVATVYFDDGEVVVLSEEAA